MQMLLYLADFEELRIVQSLKEFEKCDKEAFVRSLWVNHKDELKVMDKFVLPIGVLLKYVFSNRLCN